MPTSEPLEVLLAHDRWATRNVIDACAALTEDQFHQPFEIGPGSLHDTLTHVIGCMRGWTDDLTAREPVPSIRGTRRTPEQLLPLLDQAATDLAAAATARPFDEVLSVTFDSGPTFSYTRGVIVSHVITHSMHHRAQCLHMLRRLGVDPLPLAAVDDWSLHADKQ